MANELKLSQPLVQKLLQDLCANDPECKNEMVACQYLAAVIGYLVGAQNFSAEQKKEMTDELTAFVHHVMTDVANQQVTPQQQQTPASPDPSQAFGIWRPSKS